MLAAGGEEEWAIGSPASEPDRPLPLLTQRQVAQLLGLTPRQVQYYADSGMPRRQVRVAERVVLRYDAAEVVRWWGEWHAAQAARSTPVQIARRRAAAEARLAELRVAEAERRVVPIEEATAQIARILAALRAHLVALPGRLAPRLWGARTLTEMQQRLESEVRDVMRVLAREDSEALDGEGSGDEEQAVAPARRRRRGRA